MSEKQPQFNQNQNIGDQQHVSDFSNNSTIGKVALTGIIPNFEDALKNDRQATINTLANAFHEVWLRTRNINEDGSIMANGDRTPRPKATIDQEWAEINGESTVDIANTGFVRLPEDWQLENAAASEVIIDLVDSLGGAENIDLDDPEVYEKCGQIIHNAWLERNSYAKGGELDVDFKQLPLDEQAKDLEQLTLALQLLKPDIITPSRDFETRVFHTINNWALERQLPLRAVNGDLISPVSDYYDDQYQAFLSGRR